MYVVGKGETVPSYTMYRKFKFIFRYETYISDIRNISHRQILTRLVSELMWLLLVFMMPYLHNPLPLRGAGV
jgi:uncharacterized membrane-anchored protein